MKRRYPVALGALSAVLVGLTLGSLQWRMQIYRDLAPFYETTDFVNRDDEAMNRLEVAAQAIYEVTPWIACAAIVALVGLVALLQLRSART